MVKVPEGEFREVDPEVDLVVERHHAGRQAAHIGSRIS